VKCGQVQNKNVVQLLEGKRGTKPQLEARPGVPRDDVQQVIDLIIDTSTSSRTPGTEVPAELMPRRRSSRHGFLDSMALGRWSWRRTGCEENRYEREPRGPGRHVRSTAVSHDRRLGRLCDPAAAAGDPLPGVWTPCHAHHRNASHAGTWPSTYSGWPSLVVAVATLSIGLVRATSTMSRRGRRKSGQTMFSEIRRSYGRLDHLINNAGMLHDHSLLTRLHGQRDPCDNVVGTFLLRASGEAMKQKRYGRIVNFSSVAVPLKLAGEALCSLEIRSSLDACLGARIRRVGITVNSSGGASHESDPLGSKAEDRPAPRTQGSPMGPRRRRQHVTSSFGRRAGSSRPDHLPGRGLSMHFPITMECFAQPEKDAVLARRAFRYAGLERSPLDRSWKTRSETGQLSASEAIFADPSACTGPDPEVVHRGSADRVRRGQEKRFREIAR